MVRSSPEFSPACTAESSPLADRIMAGTIPPCLGARCSRASGAHPKSHRSLLDRRNSADRDSSLVDGRCFLDLLTGQRSAAANESYPSRPPPFRSVGIAVGQLPCVFSYWRAVQVSGGKRVSPVQLILQLIPVIHVLTRGAMTSAAPRWPAIQPAGRASAGGPMPINPDADQSGKEPSPA
jgi:hypothetical protein